MSPIRTGNHKCLSDSVLWYHEEIFETTHVILLEATSIQLHITIDLVASFFGIPKYGS